MLPPRYFCPRYFATRYFPPGPSLVIQVSISEILNVQRTIGEPLEITQLLIEDLLWLTTVGETEMSVSLSVSEALQMLRSQSADLFLRMTVGEESMDVRLSLSEVLQILRSQKVDLSLLTRLTLGDNGEEISQTLGEILAWHTSILEDLNKR